jgi:mannan endo-1,4-beta-mannosidase
VKLDLVADFFSSLKTASGEPVPLIFRPWHEMNHGWFWWGSASCTPDEYKSLYRFTVDYLKDTRGLHNILYAFSPDVFESEEEYLRFYPGDDYVDILGVDNYAYLNKKENAHRTIAVLEMLDRIAGSRSKPFAIMETGLETIPNPVWFTDVVLSTIKTNVSTRRVCWILFWRNGRPDHFYAPYPGHPSAADFIKFKEDDMTWFLSDISNIYKKGGAE